VPAVPESNVRQEARPGSGDLPAHVTMPLLQRIVDQSMDEEYAEAAHRRGTRGPHGGTPGGPGSGRVSLATVLGVVAAFGLLVATAFVQHSRDAEVDATSRSVLLTQVVDSREGLADQQQRIGDIQAEIVGLEQQATSQAEDLAELEQRNQRLGLVAGYVPVEGEGIRIVVDDSPDGSADGVVRDEDLALLVDGLWGAGAEAVAINGQRLSVLSAIRTSGAAINVNSRPLSPPYRVEAIGDTDNLQSRLLSSPRGNEWFGLAQQLGFVNEVSNVDRLSLPASRERTLRYAVARLSGPDPRQREETAP
jgi:uncharacterized protein YlxW (UPF0749 family)